GGPGDDCGVVRQEQGEDERKLAHWLAPPGDKTVRNCNKINGWALHHCVTSQTSAVPSALPEASVFPSADHAREVTLPRCPTKRRRSLPVVTSQSRMVRSKPAEASVRRSGETARQVNPVSSPRNRRTSLPVATSHWRMTRSLQVPVRVV